MRGIVKFAPPIQGVGARGLSLSLKNSARTLCTALLTATCVLGLAQSAVAAVPPTPPPPADVDTGAAPTTAPAAVTPPATTAPVTAGQPGQGLVTGGPDERTGSVRLLVNKSTTLVTSRPYKRVNVSQPEIAEVNGIGPTRILVTGKKAGATQIIVWDEEDNSQQIDVLVQANLLQLRQLYERLLPGSTIDVIDNDGTIALTGQVPNLQVAEQATALASGFGNKVLNLLEVAGGQQVMLQVRFAEVSKTATTALGVNLGFVDSSGAFGASNIGLQQFTLREIEGISQFAEN